MKNAFVAAFGTTLGMVITVFMFAAGFLPALMITEPWSYTASIIGSVVIVGIMATFNYVGIVFWGWGLVVAIMGEQSWFSIVYYVAFGLYCIFMLSTLVRAANK